MGSQAAAQGGSGTAVGTESGPARDQSQGTGGTVPIGVPVSDEEFRRQKEQARNADPPDRQKPVQEDR